MQPRQMAFEVVKTLQNAGFQALFAGGCVRDSLLNRQPKDYDVATSATPDEVQQIFGHQKTLAIGKSFGVITVIGANPELNIEVATFRRDGGYSDGRHPDSVEFTDAREDALRRDFTINGMFFDPIADQVIDYVDGQADLQRKVVRAIGVAAQRIEEDRLRMLRGVRFAATYEFELETETLQAIQNHAGDIDSVSPERIGAELRKMLDHPNRDHAFKLLIESKLWTQVLPPKLASRGDWQRQAATLAQLDGDFPAVLAAILHGCDTKAVELQQPWRLTNLEVVRSDWILKNSESLQRACEFPWSELQPLLISPHAGSGIQFLRAIAARDGNDGASSLGEAIRLCETKLALDAATLNPPPLIGGDDLMAIGMSPGPEFKSVLAAVRSRQLDGELTNVAAAKQWVAEQRSG